MTDAPVPGADAPVLASDAGHGVVLVVLHRLSLPMSEHRALRDA
ncbi:MAG: hypothetical protein M0Z69_03150 [Actinomycetota bacterium]|nr:hypothetical protein [Actinomycetota bacterium]